MNNKGFTLIELMITVAIVGILAALALPAYQNYTIKAQVSEGLVIAGGAKGVVAEYYSSKGSLPISGSLINYSSNSGKYIKATSVQDGSIIAVFGNDSNEKIHDNYIRLIPNPTGVNLTWDCVSNLPAKYLPVSCNTGDSITIADNTGGNSSGGSDGGNSSGNTGSTTPIIPEPPISEPPVPEPPVPGTDGKNLSDAQKSKYPEVNSAYQRFFDSANKVNEFTAKASALQQQAQAAASSGDMNRYNQLMGQANNENQQANNYKNQMNQAQTQYNQAIDVYKGRNNGSLPGDFPVAPKV